MNKKALLIVGLSLVLLVALAALSWAVVQPRPKVAQPGAQRVIKHHPNKAEAFEITHFDFESDNGQWTPGLPGEYPHTTTRRYCSADTAWWFGIEQYDGYASDWRNYLDTDPLLVTAGGISLQFNHVFSIEKPGFGVPDPDDEWDIANLQISVNGGPFYPLNPHFTGWTGEAYAGTSSYAYDVEWNIGPYYGGWADKNTSWPSCDASGIAIQGGDQPFRPEYSTYTIQATDTLVFRFEFCSDPAYSSAEGDPVEGWYVDDIVATNDNGTYENYGSNQGATLQMHPGYHDFPSYFQWVTDNYAPHEYKSATHSWWVPDTTVNGNSYLVSPWIQLPDTAKLVWIEHWQDQFSPGAAIEGYLHDYYYWYVRNDQDLKWKELTHDYDRVYDSTHCDWDVSWRDWTYDSLYNGTFFVVPDKFNFGSKVQFAFKYMTDDVVQYTGKQTCGGNIETHNARGFYLDDFTVWGQKCYDQNMGLFWETECSRPLPLSVPAGSSWAVKMLVRSQYSCGPTDLSTEVDASIAPPNYFSASTNIPAGYPSNHDTLITIGTFTASQEADTAQTFDGEVLLSSDVNHSDDTYSNVPEFIFFVTDSLREYMGYDDLRMKTGQRAWTPYDGVGVWFEPNFNWGGYKLLDIRWLSAYSGSTRVKIYYPVTPTNTWYVNWPPTAENPIPCPVDTSLDLSGASVVFDTTIHVPYNDWAFVTFYDEDGNVRPSLRDMDGAFFVYLCWEGISSDSVGGVGFDGPETIGGHTFLGQGCDPAHFTHYCNYDQEEPWQDASMRASVGNRRWVPPAAGPLFIRGDYDANGQLLTNDPLMELQFIFGVPGASPPSCESAADYNDDGSVLTNDPLMALQYIFGVPGSTAPPAPYPDCGMDPTPDDLTCVSFAACAKKGAEVALYKPSLSVKGAENRLVAGEPVVEDGLVRVPVELRVTEPVCGLDISLGYDASALRFKEVDGGYGYDFWAVDTRQAGVVRIGAVPDIEMAKLLEPGTHRVGEVVFEVVGKGDMGLRWQRAEVYGADVQPLSMEWVAKAGGSSLPTQFALEQNYPNPFNPSTQIRYALPVDCQVRLEVYNVVGQRVATLVDGHQKAGYKVATWNAQDMASGVYFYRLTAGNFTSIHKMVLLK